MKYAFLKRFISMQSFFIVALMSVAAPIFAEDYASAKPIITNLKQSQSLNTVREFMVEVREDLESYYLIFDRPVKLNAGDVCVERTKSEVMRAISKSILLTLNLYPDEELPVDEALSDLKSYLTEPTYKECVTLTVQNNKKIEKHQFVSKTGRFFIRLDFFSPVSN